MSLPVTITDQLDSYRARTVVGTIGPLTGNYTTGGVTVDFVDAGLEAQLAPLSFFVEPLAGYPLIGVIGADATSCLLQGFSAANTELTNAAPWPTGLLNASAHFRAIFYKNL